MKICTKCNISKEDSCFRKRQERPSGCGLRSQCKECDLAYEKSSAGQRTIKKYRNSAKGKLSHKQTYIRRRDRKKVLDVQWSNEDLELVFLRL